MRVMTLENNLTDQELLNFVKTHYAAAVYRQKADEEFMSKKKFPFGTVVRKVRANRLDRVMGTDTDDIGIIVGCYDLEPDVSTWDGIRKEDMYRVHYSSKSPYIGEHVNNLESYEGPIPEHLKNVNVNGIHFYGIR